MNHRDFLIKRYAQYPQDKIKPTPPIGVIGPKNNHFFRTNNTILKEKIPAKTIII